MYALVTGGLRYTSSRLQAKEKLMRFTIALRTLVLFPALISSTVLFAQFQPPTPE